MDLLLWTCLCAVVNGMVLSIIINISDHCFAVSVSNTNQCAQIDWYSVESACSQRRDRCSCPLRTIACFVARCFNAFGSHSLSPFVSSVFLNDVSKGSYCHLGRSAQHH